MMSGLIGDGDQIEQKIDLLVELVVHADRALRNLHIADIRGRDDRRAPFDFTHAFEILIQSLVRSPAPNSLWNDFVRSMIISSRLSDSRAFRTLSFSVVEPNKELKTFFGLYSIGSGVLASRNDIVAAVFTPLPAACCLVVSDDTSMDGSAVS